MVPTLARMLALALAFCLAALGVVSAHGGELWTGLGEKNRIHGKALESDDLLDMVVLVGEFDAAGIKEFPFVELRDSTRYADDSGVRYKAFCSLRGSRLNAQKFTEKLAKMKKTIDRDVCIYQDAGTTNEPPAKSLPFYYVVGVDGTILHSGDGLSAAIDAANSAVEKLPKDDPIFGIAKIDKLSGAVTNYFREGQLMRPGMAWLKRMAGDKDPATAEEARHLAAAIVQKRDMRLRRLVIDLREKPGMTAWRLECLLRMWPDSKTDKHVIEINEHLKKNPEQIKLGKIVIACEREAEKPIKKSMEAKKAAVIYKGYADRLKRMQTSKDLAVGTESQSYLKRVEALLEEMKNWQPPQK